MSKTTPRHPMTLQEVQFRLPGIEEVRLRGDLEFRGADGEPLALDLYLPAAESEASPPVVLLASGYPDGGMQRIFGCRFKEMVSVTCWARLIAASGLAAIAATNREPAGDVHALLDHVAQNAAELGVDRERIGLWACSGHAPLALSLLFEEHAALPIRCAALSYAYLLDLDGNTAVADAAAQWRFANPGAGRSIEELRRDVPLFLARAGRDEMPGLNAALDRFVTKALTRNLPLTLTNHPAGPHAFDLLDDSAATREVIRQALSFLASQLGA